MKIAILLVTILLLPALSTAEQGVYRDRYGNTIGSYQDNGNQRTYRDSYGNQTGSSSRDGERRDYRDQYGNYEGSQSRDRNDD